MLRHCLENQGHVDKQRCPQAPQVLGGGQEELDPPSEEDPPLISQKSFHLVSRRGPPSLGPYL